MPIPQCTLSDRSVAELAWIISRVHRTGKAMLPVRSNESLISFWQSTRSLEKFWLQALEESGSDVEFLSRVMPQFLTIEMLVRIWATAISETDRPTEGVELNRFARRSVDSLTRVRNVFLSRLLELPQHESSRAAELDRLRRRSDRWTDVLVGCMSHPTDRFEFAFDSDRAREFNEETVNFSPVAGPSIAEHLVSAGLRLSFVQHLSSEIIVDPPAITLVHSILSSIPANVFQRDGSLRSLLEIRIASSRQLLERRATLAITPLIAGNDLSE